MPTPAAKAYATAAVPTNARSTHATAQQAPQLRHGQRPGAEGAGGVHQEGVCAAGRA